MSSARSATKKKAGKKTAPAVKARTATAKGAPSATSSTDATVDMCRKLAAIVEKHTLAELIVDTPDATLTFRRGFAPAAAAAGPMVTHTMAAPAPAPVSAPAVDGAAAAAAAAEAADSGLHEITSPFVGTFYRSPSPDSPSYCEVGQRVEKGQVLCIVEAMKLMNEIEADASGTIESILVENAEAVEYGQALFKIRP